MEALLRGLGSRYVLSRLFAPVTVSSILTILTIRTILTILTVTVVTINTVAAVISVIITSPVLSLSASSPASPVCCEHKAQCWAQSCRAYPDPEQVS